MASCTLKNVPIIFIIYIISKKKYLQTGETQLQQNAHHKLKKIMYKELNGKIGIGCNVIRLQTCKETRGINELL